MSAQLTCATLSFKRAMMAVYVVEITNHPRTDSPLSCVGLRGERGDHRGVCFCPKEA